MQSMEKIYGTIYVIYVEVMVHMKRYGIFQMVFTCKYKITSYMFLVLLMIGDNSMLYSQLEN